MEVNQEKNYEGMVGNGFIALLLGVVFIVAAILSFIQADYNGLFGVLGVLLMISSILTFIGIVKLEPNEAMALVFFGKYKGTFTQNGFHWVNPLMTKKSVSLRARNLNPEPIKVNDKAGNPIMIGMVLVWKLENTYKALFEIDSQSLAMSGIGPKGRVDFSNAFEDFVRVQSDAALRQVAGCYAYDNANSDEELTLRSNADEINEKLVATLNDRLSMAGIHVTDARINYLAYAPEIAAVMLRRQQADAIIAAREKIVEGAVSMVKIALDKLNNEGVVNLDEERKAAMVSNLLVVLCGDEQTQPVVNAGTLY